VKLRPGQKLTSAVCTAEVVIVRAPAEDLDVGCGGVPMVERPGPAPSGVPDPAFGEGPLLGKRYADEDSGLEVLCSRAGTGSLTANGRVLQLKGAKPLPASD
jgi:hypothetical protein